MRFSGAAPGVILETRVLRPDLQMSMSNPSEQMLMSKITPGSLMTLEAYSKARDAFRARVMEHKNARRVEIGPHVSLHFEDELTVRYQVQEMLRIERIFEEDGIRNELEAYNPLIPDGANLKATMMIEYPDLDERRHALARLKGVEDTVWLRVGSGPRILAIADEDLERENDEKTSAVHFLRFELDQAACDAARTGAAIAIGIDHPEIRAAVDPLPRATRDSLAGDLA